MAYDDAPTPARLTRGSQGQRCASCGHVEPDQWARFCGVCGAALAGGGPAPAGGQGVQLQGPTAQQPPVRYAPSAPPVQPYAAGPISPADRPEPISYSIPSVGFAGPARIGAAVAAAFMLLPC